MAQNSVLVHKLLSKVMKNRQILQLLAKGKLDIAMKVLMESTTKDPDMHRKIIFYCYCIEAIKLRELRGILDPCVAQAQLNIIVKKLLKCVFDDDSSNSDTIH